MQKKVGGPTVPTGAIIVMGVSGCGKSTLAQLLAMQLQCPFIEADALHAANSITKMTAGEALTDDDRWPWLERVGAALQNEVAQHGNAVATCSALKYSYRERLRKVIAAPTFFILLDADHAELTRRLTQRSGHYMPASLLTSQLNTLERPQGDERALTLDAQLSSETLCSASLKWLALQ